MLQAKTKEQRNYIELLAKKKVAMAMSPFMTIQSIIELIVVLTLTFPLTLWQR